jgi:NAD(P)-dependent dehydrogenase (short-subunit alcohol dehydrogenase family)
MKKQSLWIGIFVLVAAKLALRQWQASRFELRDKVVVITGGSRGLGLALAEEFARHDAVLVLIARDEAELSRAAGRLRDGGARVQTCVCDVRREEDLESAIDEIGRRSGGIDVLVNNAGEIVVGPIKTFTPEEIRDAMEIHFNAPLTAMFAALPWLRERSHSRIVNIASFGGQVAVPHLSGYCASKFALVGLSDSLRSEWAADGIQITTVCPGLMRTGSHFNAYFKGDYRKEFTWFSLGLAAPFISISARRAARQVVAAARRGDPNLTITWSARAAVMAQGLWPNLVARLTKLVARVLPSPGRHSSGRLSGWESWPRAVPEAIFVRADRPARRWNEVPQGSTLR